MFKRALVSTSDKSGLLEFIKPLVSGGCQIVSTGGTSKFLRDGGVKLTEVSEVTGFPEVMDGRVRTLHPFIHMAILARSFDSGDMDLLKKNNIEPFDLVVVNLYPFEEAVQKGAHGQDLVDEIDIGGPALLRAAAKSFERVTVICDPADYQLVLNQVQENGIDEEFRKMMAIKVFERTAFYDSFVARILTDRPWHESSTLTAGFRKHQGLRYGENPHQKAVWYESPITHGLSLTSAEKLQGKELSYNNILDLEAAIAVVADFDEPAAAVIKHLTPCGVALGSNIETALDRALDADRVSAFGGIIALNRPLQVDAAEKLRGLFLECIVAPGYSSGALEILAEKKNFRVLVLKNLGRPPVHIDEDSEIEWKSLRGGALAQTVDKSDSWDETNFKIHGKTPSDAIKRDMIFAQKVVRHVKSNAIVVVKDCQTLGICGGQTNRIDSVKMALSRAHGKAKDMVLGSDAFFPFRDSVDYAAENGVTWIIQPGGSVKDAEVVDAVNERGIGMVVTGRRHFKH